MPTAGTTGRPVPLHLCLTPPRELRGGLEPESASAQCGRQWPILGVGHGRWRRVLIHANLSLRVGSSHPFSF